ncbi:hypothetical protein ISN75_14060 [Dyella marensis]|uniref:hypothetical protein n=1 Tax=Dyella marensis TaxID=500610 RepID=UPI0031E0A957
MTSICQYALDIFRKLPEGVDALAFIAGGCFRSFYDGTPVKDYDLFFASHADWELACGFFRINPEFTETTGDGEGTYPSFKRENEPAFNLIGFRFHRSVRDLAESFDFTCVAVAAEMVEPGVVQVFQHPEFVSDASGHLLNFQNLQHIDRVERRVSRYEAYGYRKSKSFLAKLPQCHSIPRSSSGGDY